MVIQFITKMLPQESEHPVNADATTSKMAAYLRMQELRKETAKPDR